MSKGLRVLICGSRDEKDSAFVWRELDWLYAERGPFTAVIDGGARGVDKFASAWAMFSAAAPIDVLEFPVPAGEWRRLGKKAGPLRNREMLKVGKPDLVIAFPGGAGTADMVKQARAAGVEVIEVEKTR